MEAQRKHALHITQWEASTHWHAGVGWYECQKAEKGKADAMDNNGFLLATIVSPRDFGKCHLGLDHPRKEVYEGSKHGIL